MASGHKSIYVEPEDAPPPSGDQRSKRGDNGPIQCQPVKRIGTGAKKEEKKK